MSVETRIGEDANFFTAEARVLSFTVTKADQVTSEDIADWSLQWMLRWRQSSETAIITKTTIANGIEITDVSTCEISIERQDTEDLDAGTYWHELWRADEGSEVLLAFGDCVLQRS